MPNRRLIAGDRRVLPGWAGVDGKTEVLPSPASDPARQPAGSITITGKRWHVYFGTVIPLK